MADPAEDEVRATFNELVSAINSGDVEALGSLMLKGRDHIHIGSEDSEWWSADEFLENFSNVNVDQGVTAEAGEVTVHVRGDVAWVEGQGYFKKRERWGERNPPHWRLCPRGRRTVEVGAVTRLHTCTKQPNLRLSRLTSARCFCGR